MAKSVRKNFGYNLVLTFCKYLFPLITYPYVSRVLGVDKIGACNFVDGLINYFILFSTLGIGSFGVREIARCKGNLDEKNRVFSSLLAINLIGTVVAAIILVLCTFYVSSLQAYRDFLWIGLVKLFFNMFLIEWFFQGLQEFKYITIRSIAIRCLYVIGVFVFVHDPDDAVDYYALTAGTTIINAVCNWVYSRKFRRFSFSSINLGLYILPVLAFGYYRLLTYMYTTFNTVFLGFCSGDREVGYFATATKLYTILMGVFTAFTTVMIPRVSELLSSGCREDIQKIADDTFNVLTVVSLPIIILSLFCADEIIFFVAGAGYEGAILPFRIVIFLLLIIGMEQIAIQQFLMASTSNKSIFIVSSVGAIVGIVGNVALTPSFGAVGTSISWGLSELIVMIVGFFLVKRYVGILFRSKILLKNIAWSMLYVPLPLLCCFVLKPPFGTNVIFISVLTGVVFCLINFKLNKNELIVKELHRVLKRRRLDA